MTTNTTQPGTDPLDPAALFGPHLGPLLAAGHRLAYAPDPAWDGYLFADLYDPAGRRVECGLGVTAGEALAHLQQRLEERAIEPEPEPCGLCQLRAERGIEPPPGGCTCQAPAVR